MLNKIIIICNTREMQYVVLFRLKLGEVLNDFRFNILSIYTLNTQSKSQETHSMGFRCQLSF